MKKLAPSHTPKTTAGIFPVILISLFSLLVFHSANAQTGKGRTPGAITGPTNACVYINSSNEAVYTIRKVAGAGSYIWTMPAGARIQSHPGGSGINDTIIKVAYDNSFVANTMISVQAVAGTPGDPRNLKISRALPAKPGIIAGPTNACVSMAYPGNAPLIPAYYRIGKAKDALSYTWSVPANASIVDHPAGTGINDTVIQVSYAMGFTGGDVTVVANNGCGSSAARTLKVSRLNPGPVSNIDIIQAASCPSRIYTYSLADMPSGATSILWTVPATGRLVSGQGTTSITVSYPSGTVSGSITAKAFNSCASGTPKVLVVKLLRCIDEQSKADASQMQDGPAFFVPNEKLEIKLFPNPSSSDAKLQVNTSGKEIIRVSILDNTGNKLNSFSMKPNELVSFGAGLQTGMYFIEISQGNIREIRKFIRL